MRESLVVVEGTRVVDFSLSSGIFGRLTFVELIVGVADVVVVGLGVVTMTTPTLSSLVVGESSVVVVKPASEASDLLPFVVLVAPASTEGYTIVAAVVARTTKRIHASLCTGGNDRRTGLAVPGVIACRLWSGMSSGERPP